MNVINKYSQSPYEFEYIELTKFDEEDIKKYCDFARNNFLKEVSNWNIEKNTYWTTRFYIAIKYIYSSSVLISSLEHAEGTNLQIVLPYLTYYSILTCARTVILTSPNALDPIEKLIGKDLSHENIINRATDILAKLNKNIKQEFLDIIKICKDNRELFSYKFPATGLDLIRSNKNITKKYYYNCRLLCELAQLNSSILSNLLTKKVDKIHFDIDGSCDSIFNNCFMYEGRVDEEDYYRAGYIARKIKRPWLLSFMMTEGMTEDFFGSWCNGTEEGFDDQYNPDENWRILFPVP
jgi:hypothetical protein